jgi:hypothetical protein
LIFFNHGLLFFFDVFLGAHAEHTHELAHFQHLVLNKVHIVTLLKQEGQFAELAVYLPEGLDLEEKLMTSLSYLLS